MTTESTIYWITRLDDLRTFLFTAGGILTAWAAIGAVLSIICHAVNLSEAAHGYESNKNLLPISKRCIKWFSACILPSLLIIIAACFVPSTRQMCAIIVLPKVVNNEQIQDIPDKIAVLANEWLEELRPKNTTNNK